MPIIDGPSRPKTYSTVEVAPAPKTMYDSLGNITGYAYTDVYGNILAGDDSKGVPSPVSSGTTKATTAAKSGGGGGGWGGGGGGSAGSMGHAEAFFDWMGRQPSSGEKSKMQAEGWTEDTIRRFAVANSGKGALMLKAQNELRQIAAPFYNGDPSGIPATLLNSLISNGDYADAAYLTNTYFPLLRGADATNPNSTPFIEDWTGMTGRALTGTATQKLSEIVKAYGYTDVARAAWQTWIKTTDSAATGNWGAEHRQAITADLSSFLGRAPTVTELDKNGALWNMNDAARQEYLRATPEYQAVYGGKPAWMDEANYIAQARAYDQVMRWYYGDAVTLNGDGSLSIPMGQFKVTPAAPPNYTAPEITTPTVAPIWKSLSNATFASELGKVGITVEGGKYMMNGAEVNYNDLLNYLPADTFYKDAQGYHYVQDAGAVDKYGKAATNTRPAVTTTPAAGAVPTTAGLTNWGISYVNNPIINSLINSNVTPEMLQQQFAWTEEAAYMKGTYGKMLAETGMGGVDFYKVASGAKGSGAMRAQIQQAQNMYAFKEVYRDYFGKDPSASDYQTISSTFVSPSEFAHRMAAKESAKAKIDQVNELLGRTLDHQVTLADLENLAMGGQGSGEIQSMIDQASRLDQFTDTLYQYKGHEPTADDYAEIAGYPSAAAFKWEITVNETMAEMKDEINATMMKTTGNAFSDEEMRIMLGKSEGWGELQKQYNLASKEEGEGETSRRNAMNVDKIAPIYNMAEQGGFKQGLPGLSDIGSI